MKKLLSVLAVVLVAGCVPTLHQYREKMLAKVSADADSFIWEKYDEMEDRTFAGIYRSDAMRLEKADIGRTGKLDHRYSFVGELSPLYMTAVFSFEGKSKSTAIERITLRFDKHSYDWRYLKDKKLIFLIDGNRITLDTKSDREVYTTDEVSVGEMIYATITVKQLREIAEGKTVKGRLGSDNFVLTDWQQLILLALLNHTEKMREE